MKHDELFQAIQQGDQKAFREIFNLYYQPLCAYIRTYTTDWHSAEEIVQKSFVVFWQKRKSITISTSLKSYLYKIAYNNFLQSQRKKKKEVSFIDNIKYEALEAETGQDQQILKEKIELLKKIIAQLPPRCKEVLELKQQGYKYREIADMLDISIKSVESQMRIAFKKIKDQFQEKDLFLIVIAPLFK